MNSDVIKCWASAGVVSIALRIMSLSMTTPNVSVKWDAIAATTTRKIRTGLMRYLVENGVIAATNRANIARYKAQSGPLPPPR